MDRDNRVEKRPKRRRGEKKKEFPSWMRRKPIRVKERNETFQEGE